MKNSWTFNYSVTHATALNCKSAFLETSELYFFAECNEENNLVDYYWIHLVLEGNLITSQVKPLHQVFQWITSNKIYLVY